MWPCRARTKRGEKDDRQAPPCNHLVFWRLSRSPACLGGRAGRHVPLQSPSLQSGKLADNSLLCSHHAASQLDAIAGRCGRNLPAGGSTSAATATKSEPIAIAAGGEYVERSYQSDSLSQRVFPRFSGHWWIYDKLSWFDVRRAHVVGGAECCRFSMFNLYRWNLRCHFQAGRSYNHKSPCPGAERHRGFAMTTARLRPAIALLAALSTTSTLAQTKPSPWFPIPPDALFETGDTWTTGGKRYRLYGVQSCLRGTSFTNAKDVKRDCGEASLAMLVSLVRDLRPMCYAAANIDYGRTVLVFCFATMEQGRNKGSRLDLGTALVSIGYAFASVTLDGRPVYSPYLVAQMQAKSSKSGPMGLSRHARPERHHSRELQASKARRPVPCRRIVRARRETSIDRQPLFTSDLAGALPCSIWRATSHTARTSPLSPSRRPRPRSTGRRS